MTTSDAKSYTGRRALCTLEGLQVPVLILDGRSHFGRVDFLVEPIGGTGEKWVSWDRVTVHGEGA